MARQKAIVKYQIATYSGEVTVYCDGDDDNERIEALAAAQLRRKAGDFPFGYQSFRVVEREDI